MNKTLFWGGVLIVGYWWMKNGNMGPSTNLLGFGSNPTQDNDLTSESQNWYMKYLQATPAIVSTPEPYTGYRGQNPTVPTISGNWHL